MSQKNEQGSMDVKQKNGNALPPNDPAHPTYITNSSQQTTLQTLLPKLRPEIAPLLSLNRLLHRLESHCRAPDQCLP